MNLIFISQSLKLLNIAKIRNWFKVTFRYMRMWALNDFLILIKNIKIRSIYLCLRFWNFSSKRLFRCPILCRLCRLQNNLARCQIVPVCVSILYKVLPLYMFQIIIIPSQSLLAILTFDILNKAILWPTFNVCKHVLDSMSQTLITLENCYLLFFLSEITLIWK